MNPSARSGSTDVPAVEAVALSRAFGPKRAVDAVDLRVRHGELVALLGPSGSGKTTLLRLLAGFEAPDAGIVRINGRTVAGDGVWEEPDRRRIGMVFQDGALFPHLTVGRNVAFGRPRPERVRACLEMVGLAGRSASYPHELSGGERQRIALARALAVEPEVVLLDEPFAALDEGLRAGLREEVVRVLREAGASALIVTHNQQEALAVADTIAVLREGRIEQAGRPPELYEAPASRWVAEFLGDADVLPGTVAGGIVECVLGRLPVAAAREGRVELLVRPERVRVGARDPAAADGRPVGRIVHRVFLGADQMLALELAGGLRVRSRAPGTTPWRVGDEVQVTLEGAPFLLPAAPAPATPQG